MSSIQRQPAAKKRERLIESHLPLVKALARRYAGPDAELDDLVQVGAVGLIKASDRFDPDKGVAFATFATPTIEGEIRHHLRDRSSAMRIPRQLQHLSGRIRRCQSELAASLGRSPTSAELAAALETDEEEVERALVAERARDAVPLASEDETPVAVEEPAAGSDDRLMLASGLRALDERERRIVYLRFHADKTERQIARELGISQAHVSRLLSGALATLRHGLQLEPATAGDTTANQVISPVSGQEKPANRPRRQGNAAPAAAGPGGSQKGRPEPVDDVDLRSAIHAWLASERGAEPSTDAAQGDEQAVRSTSPADATDSERKPASTHSGRFLVRMPGTLHEQLARAAEREQVSLNRFVTDALATTVSPARGPAADPDAPAGEPDAAPGEPATAPSATQADPQPPPARTIRMILAANVAVVVLATTVAAVLLVLALERGI